MVFLWTIKDLYFSHLFQSYYESIDASAAASAKKETSWWFFESVYGVTLNKLNQNFQPQTVIKFVLQSYWFPMIISKYYKFSYRELKDDMILSFSCYKAIHHKDMAEKVIIPVELRGLKKEK